MGKKLNSLVGKGRSKTSELRKLAKLGVGRVAILKNRHTVVCNQEREDVIQMLRLGSHQHNRALLRVEKVIEEQNAVDALLMIEVYCHLLADKTEMITHNRECPDELKEMVSTLIFAASRCGVFPELEKIRRIFTSKYGKDFADNAIQITNNCGVHPQMVHKLSSLGVTEEARRHLLNQIAKQNGIALKLQDDDALHLH